MAPISISDCAKPRIVSKNECVVTRVGIAWGNSRVVDVTTKTVLAPTVAWGWWGSFSATSVQQSRAVVAAGSETAKPCLTRHTYRATPMDTATETACAAQEAAMSPRLLRVVCCPPPHVFLGLCTTLARTELERMPAAASWVASRGNTAW